MNFVDGLLDEALITAPGCPDTLVERALRTSASEFYRDSQAWCVTLDPVPVTPGRREVELDVPAGCFVVRVFWAKLDDEVLTAASERNLLDIDGAPRGYALDSLTGAALLDRRPVARASFTARVALAPRVGQDQLPDSLFAMHRNGILYGAQRALLSMPGVPWSDLRSAAVFAQMAEAEKFQAQRVAREQQAPVVRKVRYGGL